MFSLKTNSKLSLIIILVELWCRKPFLIEFFCLRINFLRPRRLATLYKNERRWEVLLSKENNHSCTFANFRSVTEISVPQPYSANLLGHFVPSVVCWSLRCPYPSSVTILPLSTRMRGAERPYQKKRPRWSECGEKGQLPHFPGKTGLDRIGLVIARLKLENLWTSPSWTQVLYAFFIAWNTICQASCCSEGKFWSEFLKHLFNDLCFFYKNSDWKMLTEDKI